MTTSPHSRKQVAQRIRAALRRRYPNGTPGHVAVDTGIAAGTVQKWFDRGSSPDLSHFLKMFEAYGDAFLAEVSDREGMEDRRLARILEIAEPVAAAGRDVRIIVRHAELLADLGPLSLREIETALARHRAGTLKLPEATR